MVGAPSETRIWPLSQTVCESWERDSDPRAQKEN